MVSREGRNGTAGAFTEEDVTVRASSFYVMQAMTRCWRCKGETSAIGFVLSPGWELREWESPEAKATAPWIRQKEPSTVWWLNYLAPNVVACAQRIGTRYRHDYSGKLKTRYWMNHCERCDVNMGDNYLFTAGKQPFGRMSMTDIAAIRFTHVSEPFSASAESFGECPELRAAVR